MHDFETKYIAANCHAEKLKVWLGLNFDIDPEFPEAIISSIYFDTFDLFHMREKVESDHIKSKFRIRWYENIKTSEHSEICFLEFKHKVGERRFKKRIMKDNRLSDEKLNSEAFYEYLTELRMFDERILKATFPVFQLSYTRKRFIVPNTKIRLCIDSDIHIKKINENILKKSFKPKKLSNCVFELKGETAVLPDKLNHLENFGFKKDSFSKYEQCYRELIE